MKIKKERTPKGALRQPGIDLVRVTGLLFVVGVHHFLYNGFYSEPQDGAVIWAADVFRWLFFCCNGIFMVLTGYLRSAKKVTSGYYKCLVPVLLSYVLCCAISFPIQSQVIGINLAYPEWAKRLITFGNYAWYVEMYIGLILISPILNLALERITEEKHLKLLALVMFCLTALPSVTGLNVIPDYWVSVYPLTYYVLGAVIRRLQPKIKVWEGLCMALIVCMGQALVSVITATEGFSTGFTQGYGGCWTTLVTLCVFLALYRVRLGEKAARILAWMAGGVFEGYLLSILADQWLYSKFAQWHTPAKYPLLFLCVTVPVFIFAILSGKLVHTLSQWILSKLPGFRKEKAKV